MQQLSNKENYVYPSIQNIHFGNNCNFKVGMRLRVAPSGAMLIIVIGQSAREGRKSSIVGRDWGLESNELSMAL